MTSPSEQFQALWKTNLSAGQQLAALMMESAQRSIQTQQDAGRALLAWGRDPQRGHHGAGDGPSWAEWQARLQDEMQQDMQKAAEILRAYLDGTFKAQVGLVQALADQAASFNRNWVENLGGLSHAAQGAQNNAVTHLHKTKAS